MIVSSDAPVLKSRGPTKHTSESPSSADIAAPRNAQRSEAVNDTGTAVDAARVEFVEDSMLIASDGVDYPLDQNASENAEDPESEVSRADAGVIAPANVLLSDGDIAAMMRELGWESRGKSAHTNGTKFQSATSPSGTGPPPGMVVKKGTTGATSNTKDAKPESATKKKNGKQNGN